MKVWRPPIFALCVLTLPPAYAAEPNSSAPAPAKTAAPAAESQNAPPAQPQPPPPAGRFLTKTAILSAGTPQAIPIELLQKSPRAATLEVSRIRGDLEILQQPRVAEGSALGFVRVCAAAPGEALLKVNDSTITLKIAEVAKPFHPDWLQITAPSPNAAVWNWVSVAVEAFAPPRHSPLHQAEVRLRLPDGTLLPAAEQHENGPTVYYRFYIDTSDLPKGPALLTAVAKTAAGDFLESEPLWVDVLRPATAEITQGECEDILVTAATEKGIDKFGDKPPKTTAPGKPGEEIAINNSGSRPVWHLPFVAPAKGRYQLALRLRGDFAGGAFPSIGLHVDENNNAVTTARVAGKSWHWITIGRPMELEAGEHRLTPYFTNDFAAVKTDRNLYLDKYAVVRVSDSTAPGPASQDQSAMMASTMMMSSEGAGPNPTGLEAAFVPPIRGAVIASRMPIRGLIQELPNTKNPPEALLLVNGQKVATARSREPSFELDPEMCRKGTNSLQIVATYPSGEVAKSAVALVTCPSASEAAPKTSRTLRFTMLDSAWGREEMDQVLPPGKRANGKDVAAFASNTAIHLNLEEELEGEFEVVADSRADEFQGPAEMSATLSAGEASWAVTGKVGKEWKQRALGTIKLAAGPKSLAVAFTNDAWEKDKGDRNLYLKAIILREIRRDTVAPGGELLYPKPNQALFGADVVLVKAWDNRRVAGAEILLDGQPTGFRTAQMDAAGCILIPYPLRQVNPGSHKISVKITDDSNNAFTTPAIPVQIAAKAPAAPGPYARAIRLAQRFAFGPEPQQIAEILTEGESAWLARQLDTGFSTPYDDDVRTVARLRMPRLRNPEEVSQRTINYLLMTDRPARARFLLWTENHFSTWIRKIGHLAKWEEHAAFDRTGAAPFLALLKTSAHSPAMLYYLDQQRSFANRLNENYARELLELHTLGVDGGYQQKDVTTLARLLNGWMLSDEADPSGLSKDLRRYFRYDPLLSDAKPKEIIGVPFEVVEPMERYDQICWALEMLAAHPSTARFISRKLAEHYVGYPANEALMKDLMRVFHESGGDMKAMLAAIAGHKEFWRADLKPKIATPLDYSLRLSRATGSINSGRVMDYMRKAGMGLFERSTPDGYQEADEDYMNSNALLQRWRLSQASIDQFKGIMPASLEMNDARQTQATVDFIAMRLTGMPLGQTSNEAALQIAGELKQTPNADLRFLASFIAQLPEANIR